MGQHPWRCDMVLFVGRGWSTGRNKDGSYFHEGIQYWRAKMPIHLTVWMLDALADGASIVLDSQRERNRE